MQINSISFAVANYTKPYQQQAGSASNVQPKTNTSAERTPDQKQQSIIEALKNRDREVRNHEQAHLNAAGSVAVSGAKFQVVTGPDGQQYATGGEVSIDTSPVSGDPAASLRKAEIIQRAALAPAQPSSQDYKVASQAAQMATQARLELLKLGQNQNPSGSNLNVFV